MTGGLAQLSSYGVADAYLTGQPQVTFFKSVYRRHTNYATEAVDQAFDGVADFNKKATVTLSRNGDLVSRVWIQVTLPDLYEFTPTTTATLAAGEQPTVNVTAQAGVTSTASVPSGSPASKAWVFTYLGTPATLGYEKGGLVYTDAACTAEIPSWPYMAPIRTAGVVTSYAQPTVRMRWCNSVGHALLSSVEVELGGQRVDKHFGEWMDVWSELSEKEEKRAGLWDMIGKYDQAAYDDRPSRTQSRRRTLYIPLIFSFNRHQGLALPLVALTYHQIRFNIEFRPYLECIRTTAAVTKLEAKAGGALPAFEDIKLYAEYVFLDTPERRRFATMPHEYLVEQLQFLGDEAVLENTASRKLTLNFNHPVKELVFVYTPKVYYDGSDPLTTNQWFRYDVPGAPGSDVFTEAKLLLNGGDRTSSRPPGYFRMVQPYQHHTRCPSKNIYVFSFALNPEDIQPSGSCNFSRIDTAQLSLSLDPAVIKQGRIKVFALSYNVLRVSGGMGGLAFVN